MLQYLYKVSRRIHHAGLTEFVDRSTVALTLQLFRLT